MGPSMPTAKTRFLGLGDNADAVKCICCRGRSKKFRLENAVHWDSRKGRPNKTRCKVSLQGDGTPTQRKASRRRVRTSKPTEVFNRMNVCRVSMSVSTKEDLGCLGLH